MFFFVPFDPPDHSFDGLVFSEQCCSFVVASPALVAVAQAGQTRDQQIRTIH